MLPNSGYRAMKGQRVSVHAWQQDQVSATSSHGQCSWNKSRLKLSVSYIRGEK